MCGVYDIFTSMYNYLLDSSEPLCENPVIQIPIEIQMSELPDPDNRTTSGSSGLRRRNPRNRLSRRNSDETTETLTEDYSWEESDEIVIKKILF
jgi:hypothetical protein